MDVSRHGSASPSRSWLKTWATNLGGSSLTNPRPSVCLEARTTHAVSHSVNWRRHRNSHNTKDPT
eukprot:2471367-Pyramimonas_sp.AAC.1